MKILISLLVALGSFAVLAEVPAALSGVYRITRADCNIWKTGFRSNTGLSVGDLAIIEAAPTYFQILANSQAYAPTVFSRVFDYREFAVGTRKTACVLENCYDLDVGRYSATGFTLLRQHFQAGASTPLSAHSLKFRQLNDRVVEVLNDGRQCLLEREE